MYAFLRGLHATYFVLPALRAGLDSPLVGSTLLAIGHGLIQNMESGAENGAENGAAKEQWVQARNELVGRLNGSEECFQATSEPRNTSRNLDP